MKRWDQLTFDEKCLRIQHDGKQSAWRREPDSANPYVESKQFVTFGDNEPIASLRGRTIATHPEFFAAWRDGWRQGVAQ